MSDSFVTPWTVAHQTPLSMGFLRQEYWSGLPFPSPGDLPDPGIEPASPGLAGGFLTTELPGKPGCVQLSTLAHKMDVGQISGFGDQVTSIYFSNVALLT